MAERYRCDCGVNVEGEGEYDEQSGLITVRNGVGGVLAIFSLWVLISVTPL